MNVARAQVPAARPNVFQRLARTWETVHPYNAGQACRILGSFAAADVDAAWARTIGRDERVTRLRADEDIERHFSAEMNRHFAERAVSPFRPFVCATADSTWFGIVYQHWVADSHSCRALLRNWVGQIALGNVAPAGRTPARAMAGEYSLRAALDLMRRYGDYRRCRKVHTMGPLDYPVRVRLLPPARGVVPGLLAYARGRGVKVSDVLLAALAEACDALVPTQSRPGRRDLAVSAVLDLRRGGDPGFGCLLGFRSAVLAAAKLNDFDATLRAVAAQRTGSTGVLWMLAAEAATRFSTRKRLYDFYRKEAPFVGGLSNVNLNGTWFAERHPHAVVDYVRVSPTGPMVPLAMNVTTLGDDLRLSMTYRTALFNEWTAQELAQWFVRRLRRTASTTP